MEPVAEPMETETQLEGKVKIKLKVSYSIWDTTCTYLDTIVKGLKGNFG
jgi:hypothetical protein